MLFGRSCDLGHVTSLKRMGNAVTISQSTGKESDPEIAALAARITQLEKD